MRDNRRSCEACQVAFGNPRWRVGKHFSVVICLILLSAGYARAAEPTERRVTFHGADETSLKGTLVVPGGEAGSRFPALVLLAGSGPTDRNGNQPPTMITNLLKQVAGALASHGVASLRFDKRGMYANASELPKDNDQYGDFFSWENFVGDAASAYQFLGQQPEVRADRVGFLGHSEGGTLALVAARELGLKGTPPAILVLMSTQGRTLDVLVEEQLRALLARQGAKGKQVDYFMDENARITKAIRETGDVPDDVPGGLKALYPAYLGKFLQSCFKTDPCNFAAGFQGPVLIISGAKDIQVSPDRDAKALDAALKTRRQDDHSLVIVPDASHNLKVVQKDDDPGLVGDVAPNVLNQLGEWSAAKLANPKKN